MSDTLTATVLERARQQLAMPEDARTAWPFHDEGSSVTLVELAASGNADWLAEQRPAALPALRRVLTLAGEHPAADVPVGPAVAVLAGLWTPWEVRVAARSEYSGLRVVVACVSHDAELLGQLSVDPCTLVRAAVAMNRHAPDEGWLGRPMLARDPVAPIRELLADPSSLSGSEDDHDQDEEEYRLPRIEMDACSCVPGSGLPRSLEHEFRQAGLLLPAGLPVDIEGRVREFGAWRWGTQPFPEPMTDYLMESESYLRGPVPDQVAFSHAGHGVNSYSLNARIAVGPVAMLVQTAWGGVYMDEQLSVSRWNEAMVGVTAILREVEGGYRQGLRVRSIFVGFSDFRGGFRVEWDSGLLWEQVEGVDSWASALHAVQRCLAARAEQAPVPPHATSVADESRAGVPLVGVAVVELEGEPPFAVAAIRSRVDGEGTTWARFDAVRREPFEAGLGERSEWPLADEDPEWEPLALATSRGAMTVRRLHPDDADWLSDLPVTHLPVECLADLVRARYQVESDFDLDEGELWLPFSEEFHGPVEYLEAHVCGTTGSVYALTYGAGQSDEGPDPSSVLAWRDSSQQHDWSLEPPRDSDRWRCGRADQGSTRVLRIRPEHSAAFLKAFDAPQWISAEAAEVASDWPERDYCVTDFPKSLARRLAPLLEGVDLDAPRLNIDHYLGTFAAGRAYLDPSTLLWGLLDVDAQTIPVIAADARGADVEALFILWSIPAPRPGGPQLAATIAASVPLRRGGLVQVEVFPLPTVVGYLALYFGQYYGLQREEETETLRDAEARRRELSSRYARSLAWESWTQPGRFADLEGRAGGADLHRVIAERLSYVLLPTIFFVTPGLERIPYSDNVEAQHEDLSTQETWDALGQRIGKRRR